LSRRHDVHRNSPLARCPCPYEAPATGSSPPPASAFGCVYAPTLACTGGGLRRARAYSE
jgi:hypothetical protein